MPHQCFGVRIFKKGMCNVCHVLTASGCLTEPLPPDPTLVQVEQRRMIQRSGFSKQVVGCRYLPCYNT